jgi:hypothetical protein
MARRSASHCARQPSLSSNQFPDPPLTQLSGSSATHMPGGFGLRAPTQSKPHTQELEVVDTLISAGIAANRAEAVRWALARIGERPAYAQLREHTRDIERLKAEF